MSQENFEQEFETVNNDAGGIMHDLYQDLDDSYDFVVPQQRNANN